eukprot:g22384.t1
MLAITGTVNSSSCDPPNRLTPYFSVGILPIAFVAADDSLDGPHDFGDLGSWKRRLSDMTEGHEIRHKSVVGTVSGRGDFSPSSSLTPSSAFLPDCSFPWAGEEEWCGNKSVPVGALTLGITTSMGEGRPSIVAGLWSWSSPYQEWLFPTYE